MKLFLICDASGSMSEDGKHLIARGVARTIEQFLRLGYGCADLKLVVWNDTASFVEWNTNEEFPPQMNACQSTANATALIALLGDQFEGKGLILTDGFWSQGNAKAIKRWKERLSKDTLRILKIGADANPQLKGADVFVVEDIFAALDDWLEAGVA